MTTSQASAPRRPPAGIVPPTRPLPPLRFLRTLVRNPLEILPQVAYEEPIYRRRLLGRDTLFVMEPDLVRTVLVDEAGSFAKADAMQRALGPALGEGLLTAEGERWRWQRRAASPIFRHERIQGFVPAMLAAAARTRERLSARSGGTVDVAHEMMQTTFDIIVETMLSGRAGIDADRVERGITDYLESTTWSAALAFLRAPLWTPYPGRRRAEAARDYLRAEVLRIVAERRSGPVRPDLLGLLLEAQDPDTDRAMSDQDLADNLLTFITAGHETTALALTWTFYLLDLHPEIAGRVLEEVAGTTAGGALGSVHVPALAYTRQVLQEAMRLYPPAPVIVREAIRDLTLGDERVPAGTSVYVPVYAMHRHVGLWDDPERFDPSRFEPEAVKARHRYAYLPFGAGPRICIGTSFALLEGVAVLATLLPAFEFTSDTTPDLRFRITLRPGGGMPMRIARRG